MSLTKKEYFKLIQDLESLGYETKGIKLQAGGPDFKDEKGVK